MKVEGAGRLAGHNSELQGIKQSRLMMKYLGKRNCVGGDGNPYETWINICGASV